MSLYLSTELSGLTELTQRVGRGPYLEDLLSRDTPWADLLKRTSVDAVEGQPAGGNKRFKPANEGGVVVTGECVVLYSPCYCV